MKLFKKVSKAGSLTIPAQMRHELNIPKGAAVELSVNDNEQIVITKHIPTCMCCGTADCVSVVDGVELCKKCAKKFVGGSE